MLSRREAVAASRAMDRSSPWLCPPALGRWVGDRYSAPHRLIASATRAGRMPRISRVRQCTIRRGPRPVDTPRSPSVPNTAQQAVPLGQVYVGRNVPSATSAASCLIPPSFIVSSFLARQGSRARPPSGCLPLILRGPVGRCWPLLQSTVSIYDFSYIQSTHPPQKIYLFPK
jgi:hypothetical protein